MLTLSHALIMILIYLNCRVSSERDLEKFFSAVANRDKDMEKMEITGRNENDIDGRDGTGQKLPSSGNIVNKHNSWPLKCGGTFEVGRNRAIYWRMNSKNAMCYHAFLGSRTASCRVALLCDGKIKLMNKSPDGGCDSEYLRIIDGTIGYMTGCGQFSFKDTPRYARNNGTDLYIYYQGTSPNTCVSLCLEDLNKYHDVREPKPITNNKQFIGFPIQESCKCGKRKDVSGRIVGGTEVFKNEFQWLTAIVFRGFKNYARRPFCGGSLINDRYVVTAAHCFVPNGIQAHEIQVVLHAHVMDKGKRPTTEDEPKYMSEVPGWDRADETDESEKSLRIDLESITCHPLFNKHSFDWDVCVLKLSQRVNFRTSKASPICLPRISEILEYHDGDLHVVAGWGNYREDALAASRIPLKLDVPFVNHKKCQSITYPSKRHLCAGYQGGGKDACAGDSGGPLMYKFNLIQPQYLLSGIVSAGEGCARSGKVGVYTNTLDVVQWIYHQTSDAEWCDR